MAAIVGTKRKRKNMPCFLCDSILSSDQENEKNHFFHATELNIENWQTVVTKPGLNKSSRLCNRHFDQDDIVKGKTIQGVFYPAQFWRLKPGTIPKHFLSM